MKLIYWIGFGLVGIYLGYLLQAWALSKMMMLYQKQIENKKQEKETEEELYGKIQ